jgi:hypothetical protein
LGDLDIEGKAILIGILGKSGLVQWWNYVNIVTNLEVA